MDSITNSDLSGGTFLGNPINNVTCKNYNFLKMAKYNSAAPDWFASIHYSSPAIDTIDAKAIDTKIDNGIANQGQVLADGFGPDQQNVGACNVGVYIVGGGYNVTHPKDNRCVMYFCAETDN